jgi:hypothetical protein
MADFRRVSLFFKGGDTYHEPNHHIVHKDDVERLIEACKELHYEPGINPYNHRRTSQVYCINVGKPIVHGPFWWSTPGLGKKQPESTGVSTIDWSEEHAWMSPEYAEELRRMEELLD